MKKNYKIKITIILMLILSVCPGCGDGTYVAEKLNWHALKFEQEILAAYDGNPPDEAVDELAKDLKEIVMRYPSWRGSSQVHLKLGKIFEDKKKFDQAQEEYRAVYEKFPQQGENASEALKRIAILYEAQNDWKQAKETYSFIQHKYTYTKVGLFVPQYFARRHMALGNKEESWKAFASAVNFYKQTIEKNINDEINMRSMNFLSQCYEIMGQPDQLVEYLNTVMVKHENSNVELAALLNLAQFFEKNPQTRNKALEYYRMVVKRFPDKGIAIKIKEKLDAN